MALRLGILVSHPIQYHAPWFRHLATRLAIEVLYAHRQDEMGQSQAGFGVEFDWDVPLLEGYPSRFLTNVSRDPGVASFRGCDTPELYQLIRRERFDAFLVFGWNRRSALQAIRACWRNRIPVLMRGDSQLRTPRSRVKSTLKYVPYRWFLPRLDAHLYVGSRNRAYLRHYGVPKSRLFFAPHFVDNAHFAEGAREEKGRTDGIRHQLGIPPNAFVFLFAGKLIPKKRPQDFLRGCLRVFEAQPEGSNVHAVVVGDGPCRNSLEALGREWSARVHFAGFRNQRELPAFYRASDGLVLPSDGKETWGLVVNEAMACGLPAVVSEAVGCAPDLIDEGLTGYTFPVGEVEGLASRMLALKRELEFSQGRVRAAVASKVAGFSMDRATEGLERALDALVHR